MRVPQSSLEELHERGFTLLEGFLGADELSAARAALWDEFPRPADYFADPSRYERFTQNQFAGLKVGPWRSWDLNRLAFHPDLVDLAARFLGSGDLRLYKTELWAKYAGAVDYDQPHHRDFGNHTLVVPDRSQPPTQMTSFLLLSDVTTEHGPTMVVPHDRGAAIPYWPPKQAKGDLADAEVAVTGPAGSLFVYRTDILHRGSQIRGAEAARFVLLADYEVWGRRWTGKAAWPNHALDPAWVEMMERATPAERCLFGFPGPAEAYWNAQTIADVGARYPQMDMTPYTLATSFPSASMGLQKENR
ncbi:MAG: phytanoyl-CoA dioxygenase family protein [Ilumatobacteraceae bacterium]